MKLSKRNQQVVEAYDRGYRVVNNEVISPYTGKARKLCIAKNTGGVNYYGFSLTHDANVYVHRLAAYQKYGPKIFEDGVVVRHLNGDSLDNADNNIEIGTQSDNIFDRVSEDRREHAIKAAKSIRKYTPEMLDKIRAYHRETKSYKDTMEMFGITSKGSLYHILNNKYVTD